MYDFISRHMDLGPKLAGNSVEKVLGSIFEEWECL